MQPERSSCGKVILLGEHAVVHGAAALAASIDRGARATARRARVSELRLGERMVRPGDGTSEGQAFSALCNALGEPNVAARVALDLPAGVGLGASAAVGVALARAVAALRSESVSSARILDATAHWEQVFHGRASGVDAAAASGLGLIQFRRPASIERLNADRLPSLLVALCEPAASTKPMIERVQALAEAEPARFAGIIQTIDDLVTRAVEAVERGQLEELGRLMNDNQRLLVELGVSTPGLNDACAMARAAGAFGAKLTGAGGGGCVVALPGADPQSVLRAWRACGIEAFSARVVSSV